MPLKEYKVDGADGSEMTVLLSDEDAKSRGLLQGTPKAEKAEAEAEPVEEKKAPPPANKARRAPTKRG